MATNLAPFVAIGHVVNDTSPFDHLGGGVSYSAVAAIGLGHEAHVITKCPPEHPYVAKLHSMNIAVHVLPSVSKTITSFENTYHRNGRRRQRVIQLQEPIGIADFGEFPSNLIDGAVVLVAPVVGEVALPLFAQLASCKFLAVTPQGYFRKIRPDGVVLRKRWEGFEESLPFARVAILSNHDIALPSNQESNEQLEKIVAACPLVALTQGPNGATLYENGKAVRIGAFKIGNEEVSDLTGAGDTFATVLVSELSRGKARKGAAVSAAFCAALKIMGTRKEIGLDAIPTLAHLVRFREEQPERVRRYLDQEEVETLTVLERS